MASFSESPAEAQPGNSGKIADQRFVWRSNWTNNLNVILWRLPPSRVADKSPGGYGFIRRFLQQRINNVIERSAVGCGGPLMTRMN
jgi:hypothetical protein